jgi:hypothetical protein
MSFILKQKKPKQGSGNGVAIARVRGGKDDKMYLVLKTYKKNLSDLPREFTQNIPEEDRKDLQDALHVGLPPERSEIEEIYYKTLAQFSKLKQKGFVLRSGGKLEPLVKDNQVEKIYVAGISGSGKSTYSSRYITNYLKKYRDNEFYIFSNVDSDECLDKLDPIRVDLQNLESNPVSDQELANSVCLFDDIATIANPRVRKITQNVLENLLEQGRHTNTTVICCAHVITNYSQTRRLLNEATSVVIFPKAGSNNLNVKYLKNYGGFSDDAIQKILHLPSRWCAIYRTLHPAQYILHEKGAYLV